MVYPKGSGEWDEGRALAQDLIRHVVENLTIAKILDVSQSCVSQWRYLAKRNGWQEGVIETYEDPEELGRKLKELVLCFRIGASENAEVWASKNVACAVRSSGDN